MCVFSLGWNLIKKLSFNFTRHFSVELFTHLFLPDFDLLNLNLWDNIIYLVLVTFKLAKLKWLQKGKLKTFFYDLQYNNAQFMVTMRMIWSWYIMQKQVDAQYISVLGIDIYGFKQEVQNIDVANNYVYYMVYLDNVD